MSASATGANRGAPSTEPESWAIVIPGRAVPKERPREGNGHWYTPARTAAWEEHVGWTWRQAHGQTLLQGSLAVEMTFVQRRARGDLTNLAKAVEDGLNGVAYGDDKQIDKLCLSRFVSTTIPERVELTVRRL